MPDNRHDEAGNGHAHHHGEDGESLIRSFVITVEDAVDWTGFGIWLTMLLHKHGDRIFRVKGMLNVKGEDTPVAVHGVQRLVHPPVHMSAWPSGPRNSRIVFIVDGIEPDRIRRSFDVFSGLASRLLEVTQREVDGSLSHRVGVGAAA